jgi:multidrug resistance efflux pump
LRSVRLVRTKKTVRNGTFKGEEKFEVAHANGEVLGLRLKQIPETELPRVKFNAQQARLAADSKVGDVPTLVARAQAMLEKAEFDFDQTDVKAPGDGFSIGVTLRPDQRVSNLPLRSWISFVNDEATGITVGGKQYVLRHVIVGQPAEVTFKMYPGQVVHATVDRIATVNPQGQLSVSGNVPNAPGQHQNAMPYGVVLKLENTADINVSNLPGGAAGTAAIYTQSAKPTHVMRKIMIRMEAWQNYIIP